MLTKKKKKTCSFKVVCLFHRTSYNNFMKSTVLNVRKHLQGSHSFMKNVLIEQFHNSSCNFFYCLGFLSRIFTIHRTAEGGVGEVVSVTLLYQLYTLRRYLNISPAITEKSSPLHTTNSWGQTRSFGFREPITDH